MTAGHLLRQNAVLFSGGAMAGLGGFIYNLVAARVLGPSAYGEVASLLAVYGALNAVNLVVGVVMARQAAILAGSERRGAVLGLLARASRRLAVRSLAPLLVLAILTPAAVWFLHLHSWVPFALMLVATALIWQSGVPRGILQGLQRFGWMSASQALEMTVRTGTLVAAFWARLGVAGAVGAVAAGAAVAYAVAVFPLRRLPRVGEIEHAGAGRRFVMIAAVGVGGVLLLYNIDVVLAKHYLDARNAGIYGGLNKIETIIFFGTVSVSQVLYPRVLQAVTEKRRPARLLLLSAAIMALAGGCAIAVFTVAPKLVIGILYGSRFLPAAPYMTAVGFIGLALALDNLLVAFLMAVHDQVLVPLLIAGIALETLLIVSWHASVGQVVGDVVVALASLCAALTVRCLLLMLPARISTEP